jgi:phosphoribosylaminoimidazole-succinocarboxamide synthase
VDCLIDLKTPQLEKIHSGKVRESFRLGPDRRLIAVTDRISCFDKILKTPVPHKGAVLNGISNYWFEATRDIVENHFIESVDPNITIVKEAVPVRIEVIVRGYLAGSMWRNYEKGRREFSGVGVPDGLKKNDRFEKPIVTPTTKEESDREITSEDIVNEGWASAETYGQMKEISLKLFERGSKKLSEKKIILVDTKYEFGLLDGKIILIDEIHTPDSSRFWLLDKYERNSENVDSPDKEYVRAWLLKNAAGSKLPDELPEEVVKETTRRYLGLHELITGKSLKSRSEGGGIKSRIYSNLVKKGVIKDGYVALIMGSPADDGHCEKIKKCVEKYGVMAEKRVVSAHKNGGEVIGMLEEYNDSIEPGAIIAVAGRSNGLGGALAAGSALPVFNCPPFKDTADMVINLNSSLIMPSKVPAATVIEPENAALAALRSLNLSRLRKIFMEEIRETRKRLREEDVKVRGR